MIIAGVNVGFTAHGKQLRDGGAAIIADGKLVFANGEERFTRQKAAGGYEKSLLNATNHLGITKPDKLFLSSCCEAFQKNRQEGTFVDHHQSHAALAFFTSPFDEALIIVADAGGNVLADKMVTHSWWEYPRQQLSIYHGQGLKLTELDKEFSTPLACGLGECYRAFTYLLGWHSGRHAGKVMALSAYGPTPSVSDKSLFYERTDGHLHALIKDFNPLHPLETAKKFLASAGRSDLYYTLKESNSYDAKKEIAALIQHELEYHLIDIAQNWGKKLGIKSICLSGGVALNCTAALRLRQATGLNVYVPPAAGDSGQCVGNAIHGYQSLTQKRADIPNLIFLGTDHKTTLQQIEASLNGNKTLCRIIQPEPEEQNKIISEALAEGQLVFWHKGRSEFGPRALGARSILANPSKPEIKEYLNHLKKREFFNPFAASCISDDKDIFFEDAFESPYMTTAFKVKSSSKTKVAAIIHEDDTCRAQIFSKNFNPAYYNLIKEFKKISGLGIVLNTSLNGHDEPICETAEDTMKLFLKTSSVSIAVIDEFLIVKNKLLEESPPNQLKKLRNFS